MQRPERLLNCNTKRSNTYHSPKPRVLELVHARPEGVLVGAELLQLCKLVGMRLRVAAHLMLLLLLIAAEEAQEAVVGDGTEQLDWGQHVTAVEHDDEGNVNEGISEVAVTVLVKKRELYRGSSTTKLVANEKISARTLDTNALQL